MGCTQTIVDVPFPDSPRSKEQWRLTFDRLGIGDKALHKFNKIFQRMDFDRSGEVSLGEFLMFFKLDRTRFSVKCFSVLDEDNSGEVDFREFVVSVWNYCSFNKSALIMFAFDLYDLDGSGTIELDEAHTILRELYGGKGISGYAAKVLAKVDEVAATNDGVLNGQMFHDLAMTHHMLLFPAFQLQRVLQNRVLGRKYWEGEADRRGRMRATKSGAAGTNGPSWEELQASLSKMSEDFGAPLVGARRESDHEKKKRKNSGKLAAKKQQVNAARAKAAGERRRSSRRVAATSGDERKETAADKAAEDLALADVSSDEESPVKQQRRLVRGSFDNEERLKSQRSLRGGRDFHFHVAGPVRRRRKSWGGDAMTAPNLKSHESVATVSKLKQDTKNRRRKSRDGGGKFEAVQFDEKGQLGLENTKVTVTRRHGSTFLKSQYTASHDEAAMERRRVRSEPRGAPRPSGEFAPFISRKEKKDCGEASSGGSFRAPRQRRHSSKHGAAIADVRRQQVESAADDKRVLTRAGFGRELKSGERLSSEGRNGSGDDRGERSYRRTY